MLILFKKFHRSLVEVDDETLKFIQHGLLSWTEVGDILTTAYCLAIAASLIKYEQILKLTST